MKMIRMLLVLAAVGCNGGDDDDDQTTEPPAWAEAFPAEDLGRIMSGWASSPTNVYAVGGAPDDGLIQRYDGNAWADVPLDAGVPLVNWVYGFGPNDVTFVGNQGTILHYDGTDFETQPTPTEEDLWGVWGAAPDDLWAVGGRGREENQATILHYDGVAWTKSSTPTLSRPSVFAFYKVWGTASNDVYVVGQRGALLRWNGTEWSEVESNTANDLVAIWGTGPNRIVAVGGRDNGVVVRFDGTSWETRSLAPLAGLNGVWLRNDGVAHIGGVQGTLATLDVDSLDYTLQEADTFLTIHAMFGVADQLYAVGGSLRTIMPPHKGVALTRGLRSSE